MKLEDYLGVPKTLEMFDQLAEIFILKEKANLEIKLRREIHKERIKFYIFNKLKVSADKE